MHKLLATAAVSGLAGIAGLTAATATATATPTGAAAPAASPAATSPAPVSAQDRSWLQRNDQTDLAEITIGQIALQRAQLADTRALATTTISDHQKALAEVRKLGTTLGIPLPSTPDAAQQSAAARLKAVSPTKFDRSYDSVQIRGHIASINGTKDEIRGGRSSAITSYAKQYLPVAEMHLKMAFNAYEAVIQQS